MAHDDAHKDSAVTAIFLLRSISQVFEIESALEDVLHFHGGKFCLSIVGTAERVVVEGLAIKGRDDEQGPVAPALCDAHITVVVDREEDVRDLGEVGQSGADLVLIGFLHEEKRHAGS